MVENGVYLTVGYISKLSLCAGVNPGRILWLIKLCGKILFIFRTLYKNFAILQSPNQNLFSLGKMYCIGSFGKDILTASFFFRSFIDKLDFSGEKQYRKLFLFLGKTSFLSLFHPIYPDVHQHIPVFIFIGAKNLLALRTELRISKYFFLHIP